jgi:hypothetical protein
VAWRLVADLRGLYQPKAPSASPCQRSSVDLGSGRASATWLCRCLVLARRLSMDDPAGAEHSACGINRFAQRWARPTGVWLASWQGRVQSGVLTEQVKTRGLAVGTGFDCMACSRAIG